MARTPKKTLVLHDYINNHTGDKVTVKQLSEIADCTIQNVYVYLRTNPDRFESMGKGTYQILASTDTTYKSNTFEIKEIDGTI